MLVVKKDLFSSTCASEFLSGWTLTTSYRTSAPITPLVLFRFPHFSAYLYHIASIMLAIHVSLYQPDALGRYSLSHIFKLKHPAP